jgi:hypothetical protein
MPQTSFSQITDIKLMPIFRLWLVEDPPPAGWAIDDAPATLVTCDALQLVHNEAESNVSITPITRRTMNGGDRQVGQMLTATFFSSIADLTSLHNQLAKYIGKRVTAKIMFGGQRLAPSIPGVGSTELLPGYQTKFLYLTKLDAFDARCEVNYRVEPAEFRMRTVITITAPLPAG